MRAKISNEKGITLTALTIYIIIFTLIIGVVTTISTFYYENIYKIIEQPKYVTEYNKFIMFFAVDIKNYNSAEITDTTIKFLDGPTYEYKDMGIYRDNKLIAKNVLSCSFTPKVYNVNDVAKNIINVDMKIGNRIESSLEKSIDFTLRYW